MELRNRNTRRDANGVPPGLHDVSLGPTVYAGERYGKMSERLKRQQRRVEDVEKTSTRLITPRLVGMGIGLVLVMCVIFWLQYQVSQRRNRRLAGDE